VAVLALGACGEEQTAEAPATAETEVAEAPPVAESAAPVTTPAPPPDTETTAATSPPTAGTTAAPAAPAAGADAGTQVAVAPTPSTTTGASAGASALQRFEGRDLNAGAVSLRLNPDQTFVMRGEDQKSVEGRYAFENGILTFSDPTGDVGQATFPMRCRLEESGEGFVLRSVEDSCTRLDNLTFNPA
jgi:hypothetical protein